MLRELLPNLQELLHDISEPPYKSIIPSHYALLEALIEIVQTLVEAVEPEDTPTDELYNDARDARIRFLQGETERLRDELRQEMQTSEAAHLTIGHVMRECAEAKAELERLRHELSAAADCTHEYRQKIVALEAAIRGYESQHGACGDCAADAEIGRLVRGMRGGTRLVKDCVQVTPCVARVRYWVEKQWPDGSWSKAERQYLKGNPAKALAAIQEVGDAKEAE